MSYIRDLRLGQLIHLITLTGRFMGTYMKVDREHESRPCLSLLVVTHRAYRISKFWDVPLALPSTPLRAGPVPSPMVVRLTSSLNPFVASPSWITNSPSTSTSSTSTSSIAFSFPFLEGVLVPEPEPETDVPVPVRAWSESE